MARKTVAEAEETRQRIIDAAVEVFAAQGVPDATLDQIARKAGVTRGAVYWHFNGKQEVLQAVLTSRQHPLELEFSADDGIELSWEAVVTAMLDAVNSPQSKQFSEILIYQGVDESGLIHSRMEQASNRFLQYIHQVLRHAIIQGELPQTLDLHTSIAVFKGLVTGLLYEGLRSQHQPSQVIKAALRSFLALLKEPPRHFLCEEVQVPQASTEYCQQ
ncbi:TetR family transcriptional regulator [Pseudomonas sp. GD03817]|jgi:TetR/AcrR family acrAB operon transcriptional repressor|uniref:TetR family transcriptional regulator n=1 Tax=Pseudomonas TaxID=286 RepID=UPI001570C818|nr:MULTISPECIES: TetR family transcriptional regulator [Pseudomonas]MCE0992412.1 TetR family transcriptional regulator [Pseudomonas alloputida]MDH1402476.1 TetR family transcriptional regulator [Pseudomonas sp. GD03730]MDH1775535.1 TetR family transcriptional regulator [Pseudomonas sp. GD03817]QKL08732.1 TetR family transcriptional regulator [Pseudomonas putida]WNI06927.1 TetR family transcriptional regulator [Pseudomonas putida]